MSNLPAICEKLKGMSLFKSFTAAELEKFLTFAEPTNFRKGDFIIRQGEDGDCMFCLAEGTCKVMARRDGHFVELALLGPGAIFGEIALFKHRPRFADVIAVTDCVLLKISEPMLHAFAALHPAASYKLMVGIIREIIDRLLKMSGPVLESLLPATPPEQR